MNGLDLGLQRPLGCINLESGREAVEVWDAGSIAYALEAAVGL